MGKTIIFFAGVVVGFLVSVATYFYLSIQSIGDPPKSRVEFTKKLILEQQRELGITCADATDVIRKYVDSIPPFIDRLSRNDRIDPADPILREGKMASDIFFTCGRLNNLAKADNIEFPVSPMLEDEKLHTNITVLHLSLGQASAAWCEAKCLADSLEKVTSSLSTARERLARTFTTK